MAPALAFRDAECPTPSARPLYEMNSVSRSVPLFLPPPTPMVDRRRITPHPTLYLGLSFSQCPSYPRNPRRYLRSELAYRPVGMPPTTPGGASTLGTGDTSCDCGKAANHGRRAEADGGDAGMATMDRVLQLPTWCIIRVNDLRGMLLLGQKWQSAAAHSTSTWNSTLDFVFQLSGDERCLRMRSAPPGALESPTGENRRCVYSWTQDSGGGEL